MTESRSHILVLGVVLIHLVSGEDIIGKTEYDAKNSVYFVYRPVSPIGQPKMGPGGQPVGMSMSLVPYRPFLDLDEPLLIEHANVLFTGKLRDKMEKHYLQITSDVPSHSA